MEDDIERYGDSEITCPYCNEQVTCDSWELNGDEGIEECPHCEKKFRWNRNTTIDYGSRGLCEENKTEHVWRHFDFISEKDGHRIVGDTCMVCGKYNFGEGN